MKEVLDSENNKYEIRSEGDVIVIGGGEQWLAEIGTRITEMLNHSKEGDRTTQALLRGEELRPGGAYAVYILRGKLYVDTRNARGDVNAREEIRRVVDLVLTQV